MCLPSRPEKGKYKIYVIPLVRKRGRVVQRVYKLHWCHVVFIMYESLRKRSEQEQFAKIEQVKIHKDTARLNLILIKINNEITVGM